jgi:hypothetical protein
VGPIHQTTARRHTDKAFVKHKHYCPINNEAPSGKQPSSDLVRNQ